MYTVYEERSVGGGLFARKILKVKKEKSKKTNKHERVYGLRFTGTGTG